MRLDESNVRTTRAAASQRLAGLNSLAFSVCAAPARGKRRLTLPTAGRAVRFLGSASRVSTKVHSGPEPDGIAPAVAGPAAALHAACPLLSFSLTMLRARWIVGCVGLLPMLTSPMVVGAEDRRLAVTDVASPGQLPAAIPSPLGSAGVLPSGRAPILPPVGLPTAPPPDAIKPMVPEAKPARPKADPAAMGMDVEGGEPGFRYLAVLSGACDALVVADHAVPQCAGKLVNVDFGNGRVAFLFTGREGDTSVVTTFSGGTSEQPESRVYRLTIDRMSTTRVDAGALPVTVIGAAEGTCTMRGDPTRESTSFECRVRHDGKDTTARFESVGAPEVYAGVRNGTDGARARTAERERAEEGFDGLTLGDRFPRTIDQ